MEEDTNSFNLDIYTKEEIVELLNKVVEVINHSTTSDNALCFREILTALRGPDNENNDKFHTTAVIRAVIGITCKSGLDVNDDIDTYDNSLKEGEFLHFSDHIRRAENSLKFLGLWSKS